MVCNDNMVMADLIYKRFSLTYRGNKFIKVQENCLHLSWQNVIFQIRKVKVLEILCIFFSHFTATSVIQSISRPVKSGAVDVSTEEKFASRASSASWF